MAISTSKTQQEIFDNSSGSIEIFEEGIQLTTGVNSFNFVGSGVDLTNTGADITVTVNTTTGAGHTIEDEGTPLTQRALLNFVGSAVTVTDDGVNDRTIVTISGGATNLSFTRDATTATVASSTGTPAVIPLANSTLAGLLSPSEKDKLNSIEPLAKDDQTAAEVTVALIPVNYTSSNTNVESHLAGIDTKLGVPVTGGSIALENNGSSLSTSLKKLNFTNFTITEPVDDEFNITAPEGAGTIFSDETFRIQDNSDSTKQFGFSADPITTGITRMITIPDSDLTLPGLNLRNTFTQRQAVAPVTLTYASSFAPDLSLSNSFLMNLTGNLTLSNPTNLVAGSSFTFTLTQDATGSRTIGFGTVYKFPGGIIPTLSTTANAKDKMFCHSDDGTTLDCVLNKDFR